MDKSKYTHVTYGNTSVYLDGLYTIPDLNEVIKHILEAKRGFGKLNRIFDDEKLTVNNPIKLILLDTETMATKFVDSSFGSYWWAEGNGACDCNRAIEFDLHDTLDKKQHEEFPELEEWQSYCHGCKRFLIVWTDSSEYTLREFNSEYPDDLLDKFVKT